MNITKSIAVLAVLIAVGCNADPGAGKTKAAVADPVAPQAVQAAPEAATRTLDVDRTQSKVAAVGAKVTRKHDIAFDDWSGTLTTTGDDLTGVTVEIKMASLRADDAKLTGHLQSPDFFDVATYPTSTFEATKITKQGGANHLVEGNLTMRGVTKQISFPATVKSTGDSVAAQAEFVINRKDFGIVYPGMPDDLIKDEVALTIALVGGQPKS